MIQWMKRRAARRRVAGDPEWGPGGYRYEVLVAGRSLDIGKAACWGGEIIGEELVTFPEDPSIAQVEKVLAERGYVTVRWEGGWKVIAVRKDDATRGLLIEKLTRMPE